MIVLGLDLGHTSVREAEHWLAGRPAVPGLTACTHLVHGERGRVVITLEAPELPGYLPSDSDAATEAASAHRERRGGRAVIYQGVQALTGTLTAGDLLGLSAIDEIRVLGSAVPATDETLIETRSFVRPQWTEGRLVLMATPAPGGRIAPFEMPNPTPCCADH